MKPIRKLFGVGDMPKPAPVRAAPVPDDKDTRINRERSYQRKYGDKGRTSTFLSDGGLG